VANIKFFDLFAGIGGFRMGLENTGHQAVGWCEKDKFAQKSYKAIYNTEGEYFNEDARKIKPEELPDFDILTAGFPCQSFSIAGKRKGFEDTRGTLFFEIARIAREKLPKILLLENVKGLLNHSNGQTFLKILQTLDELGYDAEWQVLNSKHFGVPQSRERVFIIGHLREKSSGQIFPIRRKTKGTLKQNVSGSQGYRVYDPSGTSCTLAGEAGGLGAKTGLYNVKACITPNRLNKRQNGRRFKENDEEMFTINTQDRHGVAINNEKIRKLTPKECWRLQGFPDWAFEKAEEVNSDNQLYRQAGNSVTVNVIEVIGERLGD